MLTIHNRKSRVTKIQKQPKKTLFKAKTTQVLFKNKVIKELKIPKLYNYYNYNMLAVNIAN
jgi:hypothetical protein